MAEIDRIGRTTIISKMLSLIDNLEDNKNFCIALNGEWGSGKSFVLDMFQDKLSQNEKYIVIKYDAWENSFFKEPLIAILSCAIDELQKKLSILEGLKNATNKLVQNAINDDSNKNEKIGTIRKTIKTISNFIKDCKNRFTTDTNDSAVSHFKSYKTLLGDVKSSLNSLIGKEKPYSKIIILVDEVDRCLPNEQLVILERLHHLFDVKNCVVVCAINYKSIASNVKTVFGVDGNEYLKKFFDIKFDLDMSSCEYLKSLFEELNEKLLKFQNINWMTAINTCYESLIYVIQKKIVSVDNREITRYYNSLQAAITEYDWDKIDPYQLFFLMIGIFIKKNINENFLTLEQVRKANEKSIAIAKDDNFDANLKFPYFDCFKEYLKIDRLNLPKSFICYQTRSHDVPSLLCYFNEVIYYSLNTEEFTANELRHFYGLPTIQKNICVKLRELVLLYSGGGE